ncbi:Retrotransposon-like protein [Zea mays]|uniref:Retrotransposon-like protein n=1 Tax=Zea mays TaxID=4577 RepID=A0A1D6K8U7_MAIZE|nr:Retrotransposon-like protein [Zea mays]
MGAQIDNSVNDGHGPPLFKICGHVHHRIGSLLPPDGSSPKFIQLYIYDTANEIQNRMNSLGNDDRNDGGLDLVVVNGLIKMIDDHNPFAKKFRMVRDRLADKESEDFIIRLIGVKEGDPVQYNLPTTDQLAMFIVGDFSLDTFKRDIIIETETKELKRISSLHPAYMALQYPLLFPFGERGFQGNVIYAEIPGNLAEQKATNIEKGGVYDINRFRVCATKTVFKIVDGDKMIQFTFHTIVKRATSPPTTFPLYVYRLTSFYQIEPHVQTTNIFVDVLGVITEIHELTHVHVRSQLTPTVTRTIIIKDLTYYTTILIVPYFM